MPASARVGDQTNHGGIITGPGVPNVLIAGMPAAVAGDIHVCILPPITHQPTTSPFPMGSSTVFVGGRPVLRVGDACICGASAIVGAPTVIVGG